MERTDILELMSTLKLYGTRAAYDEVMATGIKRRREPPRIVGDLLSAEIAGILGSKSVARGHRAAAGTGSCTKSSAPRCSSQPVTQLLRASRSPNRGRWRVEATCR